jgi:hypothetical protein
MGLLTSLLAIAALLVVFSTLTTSFVEVIHGLVKQRVKGLEQLVGAMFDNLFTAEKTATADRQAFVAAMTTNPASRIVDPNKTPLFGTANTGKFDWLDLRQFIQQLADTEIGGALAANEATLKQRLAEIAAQFERYAEGTLMLFRRRSGIYAGIAGVGLAAFMNVDGSLVASKLFSDAGLSQRVVVEFSREELEKLIQQQDELLCTGKEGDEKTACENEVKDKVATQVLASNQARLEGLGVPIGTSYFPVCKRLETVASEPPPPSDPRCEGLTPPEQSAGAFARAWHNLFQRADRTLGWLISIIVTGALFGLGAPFWFDLYKRIANFAPVAGLSETVLKAVGSKSQSGAAAGQTPAPSTEKALTPEELVEIFKLARAK